MSGWWTDQWQTLVGVVSGAGGGALLVKLVDQFRRKSEHDDDHEHRKRQQSDTVALDMVQHYEVRLAAVEEKHGKCQEEVSKLHEFYSDIKADLHALLTAIELSPEKAIEAVAIIKAKSGAKVNNARQAAQIETSSDSVRDHVNAPTASAKAVRPAIIPKN
jgi:hypothetical protein